MSDRLVGRSALAISGLVARRMSRLFVGALLMSTGLHASAEEIVGVASVIDGGTLEIHGERIRLHGIDAPESNQQALPL